MSISFKHTAIIVLVIMTDLAVYVLLGLLLMDYDDFYEPTKGEYWSLGSMSHLEKLTFIGLNVWHTLNVIGITYLVYQIIRKIKRTVANTK